MKTLLTVFASMAALPAVDVRANHAEVPISIASEMCAFPLAPRDFRPAPIYAPMRRGYWREVSVPVWIPGRWIVVPDTWGRHIRTWEAAHREYRKERVWVEAKDRRFHDRDRSSRWIGPSDGAPQSHHPNRAS